MKFNSIPITAAEGKILGHNIAGPDGRRAFRKGKPLTAADITKLQEIGRTTVFVAELEDHDINENIAAQRIALAAQGSHTTVSKPTTGRSNLHASQLGILRIDEERLMQINLCEAVTLATLQNNSVVTPRQMVATLKIIAYSLPKNVVREAEILAQFPINTRHNPDRTPHPDPIIRVDPLPSGQVSLILSGSPTAQERITHSFEKALRPRLNAWGSDLSQIDFVPLEHEGSEQVLANTINQQIAQGADLILLAGETAIMDRYDIAPTAVELAGGRIISFGAPVDPGNLLMLARHDGHGRTVHILGAPGCSRSPKKNIIDLIIPRLLVGDYLTKIDIVKLGHGGLLEDVTERPRQRRFN